MALVTETDTRDEAFEKLLVYFTIMERGIDEAIQVVNGHTYNLSQFDEASALVSKLKTLKEKVKGIQTNVEWILPPTVRD